MKKFFIASLLFYGGFLLATIKSITMVPLQAKENRLGSITILDQKELLFNRIGGERFSEISDLAYDKKEKKLYMVGDKGQLYLFRASFGKKIEALVPLYATTVKGKGGKVLRHWQRDTEGLDFDKEGQLLLSFEEHSKVVQIATEKSSFGEIQKEYLLPQKLTNRADYRSKNKLLESLVYHSKYGVLYACEWPLKPNGMKQQTIYSLGKREWKFEAEPEAQSGVTAMEVLPDGNLLVLERSYVDMFSPLVITLKKIYLHEHYKGVCKSKVLAKFNSANGWKIDNFEGLAHIAENRYVMVSDNNDNPMLQRTLFIYFEVDEVE
jgi:hypothetical protein